MLRIANVPGCMPDLLGSRCRSSALDFPVYYEPLSREKPLNAFVYGNFVTKLFYV